MALEHPSSFLYLYHQSVRDVRCSKQNPLSANFIKIHFGPISSKSIFAKFHQNPFWAIFIKIHFGPFSSKSFSLDVRLQSELHESQMIDLRAIQIVESSMCFEDQEQERTLIQKSLLDLRKSLIRMIEKKSQDVSFIQSSKNEMNSLRKSLQSAAKVIKDLIKIK